MFSGFKTKKEAERFRIDLAHSPAFSSGAGPYEIPRLRVQDFLESWIDERASLKRIREKTAAGYRDLTRLHITPWIGHIPLVRLSPPTIQGLYNRLLPRLSPTTVRQIAAILSASLNEAVRRGLILRNPCANTTPPAPAPYDPTLLSPEQIQSYLDDAREKAIPTVYALYVTACGTGMRLGELLGLREADLRLGPKLRDAGLVFCGDRGVLSIPLTCVTETICPVLEDLNSPGAGSTTCGTVMLRS